MDKIKAMQTFVRIVEANSFSKAAETLNLPRAALTATLQKLEAYLGTQLLQRTTRRLSLTPEGADYFRHCIDILKAVDTAELAFRGPEATASSSTMPGAMSWGAIDEALFMLFPRFGRDVAILGKTGAKIISA